jgi:hypothetical protein
MKKLIKLLWALPLLGLSFCTTKVDPTADIPVVSFNTDVLPVLSANCALSGCHNGGNGELGSLLSYNDVISYGHVKAGDAHGSNLYKVCNLYVGNVMPPKPSDPLSDEQIGLIYVWILQGAKDN